MNYQPVFERLNIQAEDLFKQATFEEYFGNHLFQFSDQDYYLFSSDEKGDAVCIVERQSQNQEQEYEVLQIAEERKFHSNPIVPRPCSFNHCELIPDTWLEDRRTEDVKSRIKQGGKFLGKKLNKAFVDVLLTAASSQTKVQVQDERLDETLADVYSNLVNEGFHPDVFLFPEHLEAKLVLQELILRDREVQNTHYVGRTLSGQAAYWSNELPKNVALIFDSAIGVTITKEPRFRIVRMRAFTPSVCGYIRLNPIVKNTAGIIAIEGVDIALNRRRDEVTTMQSMTVIPYIDLDRIEELRAISSRNFDLTKLIKLCEEINTCYTNECYLAVAMLVRAMLDHIPPIFGYTSFREVANNYGGGRSLRKSLQNLQNSSRNIADAHLHLPIRSTESLPNKTQVNFSNDLDVLLSEIVRALQ